MGATVKITRMIQKDCPTGLSNFNVLRRVRLLFLQHSDHADSVCGQAASLPRAWVEGDADLWKYFQQIPCRPQPWQRLHPELSFAQGLT